MDALSPYLDSKELLESRAQLHQRYAGIEFKVLEVDQQKGRIVLRISQERNHAGNYFDNKRLSEIGRELFEGVRLPDGWTIITRPIPYMAPPTDIVTPEWIQDRFAASGLSLKQAATDLGVDPNTLSAYRSGLKPLSGTVKAMFFYYLK